MPNKVWFLVVDAERGRLLECSRNLPGRIHVSEHETIEYTEEEQERSRPSPLSGKRGNTYASAGQENAHQRRRFAKEVVGWIEKQVDRYGIETLTLIAARRFLGELRKLYGPSLQGRIREQPGELAQLTTGSLARHPTVMALLPPEGATG